LNSGKRFRTSRLSNANRFPGHSPKPGSVIKKAKRKIPPSKVFPLYAD
jgi:hypothetical protein